MFYCFDAIVDGIVPLISFFNYSLQVYGNAIHRLTFVGFHLAEFFGQLQDTQQMSGTTSTNAH